MVVSIPQWRGFQARKHGTSTASIVLCLFVSQSRCCLRAPSLPPHFLERCLSRGVELVINCLGYFRTGLFWIISWMACIQFCCGEGGSLSLLHRTSGPWLGIEGIFPDVSSISCVTDMARVKGNCLIARCFYAVQRSWMGRKSMFLLLICISKYACIFGGFILSAPASRILNVGCERREVPTILCWWMLCDLKRISNANTEILWARGANTSYCVSVLSG